MTSNEGEVLNFSFTDEVSHLALDMGGSLIKMVYLSRSSNSSEDQKRPLKEKCGGSNGCKDLHLLNGRLQFMKFETSKINECLEFISSMQLHSNGEWHHEDPLTDKNIIKATGVGSYKFADLFREKLGITLDKVEELKCYVDGANFLLKADHSEAFTYTGGQRHCLQIDHKDLYPFLLVIIGTGVSMCKVEGPGKFNLLGGTSIGGGTFLGLGRLLTKCKSFDELVELSHQGNNSVVDIRLQDILGEMDYSCAGVVCPSTTIVSHFGKQVSDNKELEEYRPEDVAASLLRMISFNIGQVEGPGKFNLLGGTSIGGGTFLGLGRLLTKCKSFDELVELSHQGNNSVVDIRLQDILGEMDYSCAGVVCPSTTIVSHFGKQVSDNKELEEYRPEDVAASLLRMISFNIGQLAQSSASRFGLKKMFFGGSFLQHDYTVDSISKEVANRSGGASKAMFFRHDGFLGALGAFMSYQNLGLDDLMTHQLVEEPRNAHLK